MVRLLVNSDDIATLTSDSATPDKVDLLLFFNNAFASKVKTICESNPPKNTFELYIMTTSGLTIQDVTNDLKLFVNGVASLNDTSRIPLSISGLTLATTGFVEFHVAYDTNYEIYSNSLSIKSCTIPEAPVLIDELTIGLPDGAQVCLESVAKNSAKDGFTDIIEATFIFTEASTNIASPPTVDRFTMSYTYDPSNGIYRMTDSVSFKSNIRYHVQAYYRNLKGRSPLSQQLTIMSAAVPGRVNPGTYSTGGFTRLTRGDDIRIPEVFMDWRFPIGSGTKGQFLDANGLDDPETLITAFNMYIKKNAETTYKKVKTIAAGTDNSDYRYYGYLNNNEFFPGDNLSLKMTAVSSRGESNLDDALVYTCAFYHMASAPRNLRAVVLASHDIRLSWDAPEFLGGASAPVVSYQGGHKYPGTTNVAFYTSETSSIIPSSQVFSGVEYEFNVLSWLDDLPCVGSDVFKFIVSFPPEYSGPVTATPGDTSILLEWPVVDDGSLNNLVFKDYHIELTNTVTGNKTTHNVLDKSVTNYTFNALTNGDKYTYEFMVETIIPDGSGNVLHSVILSGDVWSFVKPSPPMNVNALPDFDNLPDIVINWYAPENIVSCGCVLKSYTITRTCVEDLENVAFLNVDALNNLMTSYTDTSANIGNRYTYTVSATASNPNDISNNVTSELSAPSNEVLAFVAPRPLNSVLLQTPTPGNHQITLNWSADTGSEALCGLATAGYYIKLASDPSVKEKVNALTKEFTDLTNGSSYTYNITPYVVYGGSEAESLTSTPFTVSIPYTNPDHVTELECESTDTLSSPSNTLRWVLPSSIAEKGGFSISSIQVYKSNSSSMAAPVLLSPSPPVDATSLVDTNVVIGYNYTYSVEVSTIAVESGLPNVPLNSTLTTVQGRPSAPPVINSLTLDLSKNIVVDVTQNGAQVYNYLMFAVPDNATSTDDAEIVQDGQPVPPTPLNNDNSPVTFTINATAESFAQLIVVVSNTAGMGYMAQGLVSGSGVPPTPPT